MKKYTHILLMALLLSATHALQGQQFPFSNYQILRNGAFNPAHIPTSGLGELRAGHQQWGVKELSWNSSSQFFQIQSQALGKREVFSWGAILLNGQIATENRLSIMPFVSAKVIDNQGLRLAVGFSAGLLNQFSNYNNVDVYHQSDNLLFGNQFNYLDLDAGVGAEFEFKRPGMRLEAGVNAGQLTGNTLTKDLEAMRIIPAANLDATALFKPVFNVMIGPRVFSRWLLYSPEQASDSLNPNAGNHYLGLSLEFERQELWFSGLLQTNGSGITAGFGMPLMRSDSTKDRYAFRSFLDMYFSMSYPIRTANVFGPSAEIGLNWKFGRERRAAIDTLHWASNFWKTETHLTEHKERYLDPNGPPGLLGQSSIQPKVVYLTYEFPDLSKLYCGETPYFKDGMVRRIGYEWLGVDGLMENIPGEVIREAIRPDSSYVRDPENLEPLWHIPWVELSCHLRVDEFGVGYSSEVTYNGEFGTNDTTDTYLLIPIVLDGRDTVLGLRPGFYMSNLELAALKLYAMGSKLEYEMNKQMGHRYRILREDAQIDPDMEDLEEEVYGQIPKLKIKKLRITSNNPNLQVFQVNRVDMKFIRYKQYWEIENDGWIDVEDPEEKRLREERRLRGEPEDAKDDW